MVSVLRYWLSRLTLDLQLLSYNQTHILGHHLFAPLFLLSLQPFHSFAAAAAVPPVFM